MKPFATRFFLLLLLCAFHKNTYAQAITEDFDNITTLAANGWSLQNLSNPAGSTGWYQGNSSVFSAQNGTANAYIAADMNNGSGLATISNWLISPVRTFKNGDVITFYTRGKSLTLKPDRLELRFSTNGTSTNVGSTATATGDFSNLLLDINSAQLLLGYPAAWTMYTVNISGLTAPVQGRIAFRYYVVNGGPAGGSSDYIGIDHFVYTPYVCPGISISPASLPAVAVGGSYSQTITQTGAGSPAVFSIVAGALPPGLSMSSAGAITGTATTTGTYSFTVNVTNPVNGCTENKQYSISVNCGNTQVSLPAFAAICANAAPVTLNGGTPAGGVYSGAGVSNGVFNPSVGTQTITYTYTDGNGCSSSAAQVFTVNALPVISFTPVTPVCATAAPFQLGNASPAGGVYSGPGVTNNIYDPAAGPHTIAYTYTDNNGCTTTDSLYVPIHALPPVSFSSLPPYICVDAPPLTLTATPAGGTYAGANISNGVFTPAFPGLFSFTYNFTDSIGCSVSDTGTLAVYDCLTGIDESLQAKGWAAYPNPATDMIYIRCSNAQPVHGVLINAAGVVVVHFNGNRELYQLQVTELPRGPYLLRIYSGEHYDTEKIFLR